MARDTAPEFGVAQDFGKNFHEVLYGLTSANKVIPIKINDDGSLDVNLETGDIEIGAVEIKDGSSNQRATVNGSGELLVSASFSPSGTQDVNIVSSVPLTVLQGTNPWIVDGSVSVDNFPATQPVSGTVTSLQGTSPWVIDGTVLSTQSGAWTTGRTWVLDNGTDSVDSVQSGAWSVAINNFPAIQPVSGTVAVTQSTSPWVVSGTVTANAGTNLNTSALALDATLTSGSQKSQIVNPSGVPVDARAIGGTPVDTDVGLITNSIIYGHTTAGGGSYVEVKVTPSGALLADVSGSSVSITNFPSIQPVSQSGTWNINNVSGTVSLPTGASTAALQTQPGVDIGDVTVNNAAGASAVNIQDGGNSITVDGTVTAIPSGTQDVSIISSISLPVNDNSGSLTVDAVSWPLPTNAATSALQTQPGVDIGDVTVNNSTGAAAVNIQDGGNSITIDGTVTAVQATGTNLHAVIDSGSTTAVTGNVTVVQPTGTNLHVVVDTAPTTAVTQNTSPWVDNITQFGSTNLSTGVGASGAGIPRVTVANDSSIKITDGTDTLLVNTDGSISAVPVPIGTHANAWNAATVSSGGNSTAIDCQFVRTISIFGNSSGNLNPMRIQASQDNTNWYTLTTFSISTGNFGTTIDFGARYLRLQSGQGANLTLTATITGK